MIQMLPLPVTSAGFLCCVLNEPEEGRHTQKTTMGTMATAGTTLGIAMEDFPSFIVPKIPNVLLWKQKRRF